MAIQRMVDTRFWIDDYIAGLDPIEKLLFLYFLTNPHTEICGIYELPLKSVAAETGIDREMVSKIVKRFTREKKMFYEKGWIAIVNFRKYQRRNPGVDLGIARGMKMAPQSLVLKVETTLDHKIKRSVGGSTQPGTPNPTQLNLTKPSDSAVPALPFNLKEEIQKLEDHERRDLQIIGLYLSRRKADIRTKEQFGEVLRRHLRAAKALTPFDDDQILKGFRKAAEVEGWTIETAHKLITK